MSLPLPLSNRRIGRRSPAPLDLVVWPVRPGSSAKHGVSARLLNLSVSGALIRCDPLRGAVVDTVIGMRDGKLRGTAVIRRIQPWPEGDVVEYGIEFLTLDPDLRMRIYRSLG